MSLTRSKAVLELGRRLVDQLEADDDLLASWMAHYIAQLMAAVEDGPAETRASAERACADAILKLWEYRSALPMHHRPLMELEPILRTLESMDLERTDFRYYAHAFRQAEAADADDDAMEWLKIARDVDYSARLLIRTALGAAAERAGSIVQPWVELAAQAGAPDGVESAVLRLIVGRNDGHDVQEKAMRERISRLETCAELASALADELRAKFAIVKDAKAD